MSEQINLGTTSDPADPSGIATLEQTKNEVAALEQQIADTTKELEAKRAQLTEAHAAAMAKAAEVQKQIAADQLETKIAEFVRVAASLDVGMTAAGMASFKKLAGELHFAGRLRQAHAARASLISRMNGETVYKMPHPSWSAMAAAWLIPAKKAA
jgi:hypothetical protein